MDTLSRGTEATLSWTALEFAIIRSANLWISDADRLTRAWEPGGPGSKHELKYIHKDSNGDRQKTRSSHRLLKIVSVCGFARFPESLSESRGNLSFLSFSWGSWMRRWRGWQLEQPEQRLRWVPGRFFGLSSARWPFSRSYLHFPTSPYPFSRTPNGTWEGNLSGRRKRNAIYHFKVVADSAKKNKNSKKVMKNWNFEVYYFQNIR